MIIYANSRVIGTDEDGNANFIKSVGEDLDSLSVTDETMIRYLYSMLIEMKKTNIHLSTITNEKINDLDVMTSLE